MSRLPFAAVLFLAVSSMTGARAAGSQECGASVLAILGRQLKVAHFVPAPSDLGNDAAGVVKASSCKRQPDDPRLTLAAVVWDAHQPDAKSLVLAVVDDASATIVASLTDQIDEDAVTQVNNGSVKLDTAPYDLAPGVRAFGLDIFSDEGGCGEGTLGPRRTLYVRDGKSLRPVLQDLYFAQGWYLQGNQPRCMGPDDKDKPIFEAYDVTIGLGTPGKNGWRDLLLTATAHRDDHRPSKHKPLHVRVPYDGSTYPLKAFEAAYDQWRK
jgi:hypothetical protein